MLLHDRANTSSAYLVNLHTAVQGYCTGSVLLSLLYCVFCFAKINCKGNAVNILARGPVRLRGAQGPSAGKDGTGSGLLLCLTSVECWTVINGTSSNANDAVSNQCAPAVTDVTAAETH